GPRAGWSLCAQTPRAGTAPLTYSRRAQAICPAFTETAASCAEHHIGVASEHALAVLIVHPQLQPLPRAVARAKRALTGEGIARPHHAIEAHVQPRHPAAALLGGAEPICQQLAEEGHAEHAVSNGAVQTEGARHSWIEVDGVVVAADLCVGVDLL